VLFVLSLTSLLLLSACGGDAGSTNSGASTSGNSSGNSSGTGAVAVAAVPTFSPAPGSFAAAQTVSISDATAGAAIYYTLDGSTPTTSSTLYSAPITVSATTTLTAIAAASGLSPSSAANGTYTIAASLNSVNHVLIMFQENRSFDHYFWDMTNYRKLNNIPIVTSTGDGLIKDGADPAAQKMFTNNISPAAGAIAPHAAGSQCTEDLTPDWADAHNEMDEGNGAAAGPNSPMNGFADTAEGLSQFLGVLVDTAGRRAMGYFTDTILNYYYFMAANFGMGDMFFSPVPSRTSANRLYIHAATSEGYVHPDTDSITQLTSKTIWAELDAAGLSWKIYISDWGTVVPDGVPSCPINTTSNKCFSFFKFFSDYDTRQQHLVPIDQYFSDVQNGTLPAVAFIETGMQTGQDEHPTNNQGPDIAVPSSVAIRVQSGAVWSSRLVNALMTSPSWKDSVFFLTWDEGGGAMDHVPPLSVMNPDGIKPRDLSGDDPPGDFTITGFRVPNIVISPFAKKNYVSHTPVDVTALLAFVEKRWNLPPLTKRDGTWLSTGADMTEFFDFTNVPWATPPTPPVQRQDAPCDYSLQ
jgi:phospholipase C